MPTPPATMLQRQPQHVTMSIVNPTMLPRESQYFTTATTPQRPPHYAMTTKTCNSIIILRKQHVTITTAQCYHNNHNVLHVTITITPCYHVNYNMLPQQPPPCYQDNNSM